MKSKAFAISVLVNIGLAVWLAALYAGKRPESATADPPGDHDKPTTHRNADPEHPLFSRSPNPAIAPHAHQP